MVKKLAGGREEVLCGVCGRVLLRGEVAEPFLVPSAASRERVFGGSGKDTEVAWDESFLSLTRSRYSEEDGDGERKLVCELCWPRAVQEGWESLPPE